MVLFVERKNGNQQEICEKGGAKAESSKRCMSIYCNMYVYVNVIYIYINAKSISLTLKCQKLPCKFMILICVAKHPSQPAFKSASQSGGGSGTPYPHELMKTL